MSQHIESSNKRIRMKNVFFIQRAAIDILLLNQATAMDICTYLVISKHTDKYGYYSGVGYKTIKERLGVGQKKVVDAIKRLKNMEYAGKKLLHDCDGWFFKETGNFSAGKDNVGWVREWFESEYNHHVWLANDIVGSEKTPGQKPLNYFVKNRGKDNHARLLLLLYKYSNRHCSGVNYKFASITSKELLIESINGVEFIQSKLSGYHVSDNILQKLGITLRADDIDGILSDLIKNNFINVSISVIGQSTLNVVPPDDKNPSEQKAKRKITSKKQSDSFLEMKLSDSRHSYRLAIKYEKISNRSKMRIKLIRHLENQKMADFAEKVFEPLKFPASTHEVYEPKFMYRLDYKSSQKHKLEKENCLAARIEAIADRCGLEPASRNGKFYDKYWWFYQKMSCSKLVGILMPTYTPFTKANSCAAAMDTLDALSNSELSIDPLPDIPPGM